MNQLSAWVSKLRGQQDNLLQLSIKTEKEFLSHGSNLSGSLQYLKEIFERASFIITVMGDKGQKSPLLYTQSIFNRSLETLIAFDIEIKNRLEKIYIIADKLEKISQWQGSFKAVTQSLGIISLNVKIHSNIIDSNTTSSIFADEGKNFTSYYSKNLKEIFSRVSQLRSIIKDVLNNIRMNIQVHQNKVMSTKEQIISIINSINKLFGSSAELSNRIKNGASKISDKVEDIVKSMQFQDISQQRLSHVINAIDDICTNIEGYTTGEKDKSELQLASQIAFLQLSHISLVKQDMMVAGETMLSSLDVIFKKIHQHSDSIKELTGISRNNQYSLIIDKLQNEMNNIILSLSENIDINRYIIAEIGTMNQVTGEISEFIKELEKISDDLRLLAVNAMINATQQGNTDIVLRTLADETKDISITATVLTKKVLKDLNWTLDVIVDLKTNFSKGLEGDIQESKIFTDEILKAINKLDKLKNIVKENMQAIDENSKQLKDIFNNLISNIYFHKIVSESLEEVTYSMNMFIENIREVIGDDMTNIVHNKINDLAGRYTIHTEQECHELASQNITNNSHKEIVIEDDDISGSIELF